MVESSPSAIQLLAHLNTPIKAIKGWIVLHREALREQEVQKFEESIKQDRFRFETELTKVLNDFESKHRRDQAELRIEEQKSNAMFQIQTRDHLAAMKNYIDRIRRFVELDIEYTIRKAEFEHLIAEQNFSQREGRADLDILCMFYSSQIEITQNNLAEMLVNADQDIKPPLEEAESFFKQSLQNTVRECTKSFTAGANNLETSLQKLRRAMEMQISSTEKEILKTLNQIDRNSSKERNAFRHKCACMREAVERRVWEVTEKACHDSETTRRNTRAINDTIRSTELDRILHTKNAVEELASSTYIAMSHKLPKIQDLIKVSTIKGYYLARAKGDQAKGLAKTVKTY